MANILTEFAEFPDEQELIGGLLIAYGELEFAIMSCLQETLDGDINTATRILFRIKGEGARIEVADAIIRPAFQRIGLAPKWGCAIGAARVCKSIRNQYAHCHWQVFNGVLGFMNLDDDAKAQEGELQVELIPLNSDLLVQQWKYFEYALDWFYYLREEYRKKAGRPSTVALREPKSIPRPLLYNRPATASPNSPAQEPGS